MTTNEQIEAIARECADTISRAAYNKGRGRFHGELTALQEMQIVLTAANRIAALKVKESGAVEALEAASDLIAHGDFRNGNTHPDGHGPDEGEVLAQRLYDSTIPPALTALRAITSEGTPDKLWCAACGKWGDHQSGTCPTIEH